MEFPRTTVLIVLVLANLFLVLKFFSSSHHKNNNDDDDFLECLTDRFERSNSTTTTDVILITPRTNASSYAFLLQSQNLRPLSTSPRKPLLFVTPYHDSEIQSTIYCSKKLGIQIRVRSGGHDYEGLSYTCRDPFVIIDMRNMGSIDIDTKEKTAWVGAGATLGQLYYKLAMESKTLAFAAGDCPTVGVGGHFSGGGYGMLSRKHGLASDHIVDARLIDANGEILDRESMGEDHFWAIRGGGSTSFGIILAFKVSLIDVPDTVTILTITRTSEQNSTQLVHRWQYIADKADENLLLRVFISSDPKSTGGNRTVIATFSALYLGRVNNLLSVMEKEFPELGLMKHDCKEMSWIESIMFFAHLGGKPLDVLLSRTPQPPFGPSFYKGKSDYVTRPIPINNGLIKGIWRFLLEEGEDWWGTGAVEFSPYGGAMSNFSEDETAFPHRAGNIFMIRYGITWDREGETELQRHLNWIRRLYSYMAPYVTHSPRGAYFNYKDLDIGMNNNNNNTNQGNYTSYEEASVWGRSYFKTNFDRLVRVKTKVDPSNFFRNDQSIPPMIMSP